VAKLANWGLDQQKAGPRSSSDRADSGVSHCGRSPRSSTTRPPCLGPGQYLCTDAGSGRVRPLGVCEVESDSKATVGPRSGIHLSVQKHFTLAAARAAESYFPSVGRRPFGWAVSWLTASDWVWDGTANPYRSYSSASSARCCLTRCHGSQRGLAFVVTHPQKHQPAGQQAPCRFPNTSGKGHRAGKVLDNTQF